ncbi:Ger(x)C family spore germination protein [Alkalicoccobacillus murimartini]|uniref:Ger(X)C family germination protein n=1 Tax=Alkalicoccobacillus murimartini TaxID=171685 RepID=A0ABT9YIR6_9BACI|nr:Ger(x)C family spore germination protein [Alkalicoccobacillus murimartini]MDQ0207757.1 Ger(x)C family germination protein [Alkalicoccobacillus murimartini]
MKRSIIYVLLLLSLSGCWDEQLLKDVALIYVQAFDLDPESDKIDMTIAIVSGTSNEKIPTTTSIISAEGLSSRDARTELDTKLGSEIYASKNQVTLFSKKLAEQDIYSVIDGNFRSPLSALTARLAVVDGEAQPALHVQTENKPLISDYIRDLLISAEDIGVIPTASMQNTLAILYDDGQDIVLPIIKVLDKNKGVELTGTALFSDRKMSGELNTDETNLLLILAGSHKGEHRMTRQVHSNDKIKTYNYITIDVEQMKRNLQVQKNSMGDFEVNIDLVLKVDANEYPADHLYKTDVVKKLNTTLSNQLTKEANEILNKLKEANCDYLSIGRRIQAFHPKDWKSMNWKDTYPTIEMNANVTVEIVYHGIIN